MATYFVASGGSNTAPYDTWAKAATSLQTALTAASTAGDIVVIQHNAVPTGDAEIAANTTYTLAADILLVSASNDGGSAWTPTAMSTANWIGNSTATRSVTFAGAFRARIYGITVRIASNGTSGMQLLNTDGAHFEYEECYLWLGTTGSAARINIGSNSSNFNGYTKFRNCTFRFGNTAQSISWTGIVDFEGCVLSSDGSSPADLFESDFQGCIRATWTGGDLGFLGANYLVGSNTPSPAVYVFDRCALGAGTQLLRTQNISNKGAAQVFVFDCANGDNHGLFGYADAFGTLTSDTTISYTGGAAGQSWKIVTTANCSRYTPFVSPWVNKYQDGASAITPRLEILRDGSTTAFTDAEVWGEFVAKVTSGSSRGTLYQDRAALNAAGTSQATGAGVGSWAGESGTAWSGKVDSGASLTPAEAGDLSARVCVGLPSTTVYVDPVIRT